MAKNPSAKAEDTGLIPRSGSSPGEGNGKPLQYSCLENPTNRVAWQATIHRVAKSQTRLSTCTCLDINSVFFLSSFIGISFT